MLGASRAGVNQAEIIRLSIQYSDQSGSFVDPPTTPTVSIVGTTNNTLINADASSGVIRQDVGNYYYDYVVPLNAPLGTYKDIWSVTVNGQLFNTMFSFIVNELINPVSAVAGQEIDPLLSPEAIKNVLMLMKLLRTRLGSDGVRRKRDAFGKYILDSNGAYILEPCNVFTTEELYTFLKASLAEFNSIPHFTNFKFDNTEFVETFQHELTEGAFILAMALQGLREKGREFQMTDDGLSYQPPMLGDYIKGYLSDFLTSYRERIKFIKCNLKPGPVAFGIRITSGVPALQRLRHLRQRQIV